MFVTSDNVDGAHNVPEVYADQGKAAPSKPDGEQQAAKHVPNIYATAEQLSALSEAAKKLQGSGIPIFPLVGKEPHGKHAPRGFYSATTRLSKSKWWFGAGSAVTGIGAEPAAFPEPAVVIDVDGRNDGFASLAKLEEIYGRLPRTATSITPGGGKHHFYNVPPGVTITSRSKAFGAAFPGIDVKSTAGHVALPPSVHPNGGVYEWDNEAGAETVELSKPWLDALLQAQTAQSNRSLSASDDELSVDEIDGVPYGSHDAFLASNAGLWRKHGFSETAIRKRLPSLLPLLEGYDPAQPYTDADFTRIAKSMTKYPPGEPLEYRVVTPLGGRLRMTRADNAIVERTEWLLPQRIPLGALTLIDGPGGVGKTTLMMGVLAAATRGRDFLTGTAIEPCNVLVVAFEDRRDDNIQKLRIYGADMARVHFIDAAEVDGKDEHFTLPRHVSYLEEAIAETGATVVFVDAIFSHLKMDRDGKMSQDVRAALHPIGEMVARTGVAFIGIRHWTKGANDASNRAVGSVEHSNFARSVFTVGPHPADDGRAVIAQTKTNLGPLQPTVAFTKVPHDVFDDNGKPHTVVIAESVEIAEGITSDDLAMRRAVDPDEKNTAAEWLQDFLSDGKERLVQEVMDAAAAANVGSRHMISRAATAIGVVKGREAKPRPRGTWRLPVPEAPDGQSVHKPAQSASLSHTALTASTETLGGHESAVERTNFAANRNLSTVQPEQSAQSAQSSQIERTARADAQTGSRTGARAPIRRGERVYGSVPNDLIHEWPRRSSN